MDFTQTNTSIIIPIKIGKHKNNIPIRLSIKDKIAIIYFFIAQFRLELDLELFQELWKNLHKVFLALDMMLRFH